MNFCRAMVVNLNLNPRMKSSLVLGKFNNLPCEMPRPHLSVFVWKRMFWSPFSKNIATTLIVFRSFSPVHKKTLKTQILLRGPGGDAYLPCNVVLCPIYARFLNMSQSKKLVKKGNNDSFVWRDDKIERLLNYKGHHRVPSHNDVGKCRLGVLSNKVIWLILDLFTAQYYL